MLLRRFGEVWTALVHDGARGTMSRVFISHAHSDTDRRLIETLVWMKKV